MKKVKMSLLGGCVGMSVLAAGSMHAANGVWTLNNNGVWSAPANWSGNTIADGAGFTADFSQLNINNNRTVTIDGAVASRTLGTIILGDLDSTHNYTIASSGSGTLTFNNNGSTAFLNQVNGANTISAPIVLADNLAINNNVGGNLTLSGGITGPRSVTNQGSGSGTVVISGIIGSNVTGVVQNSATSQMTLSGANTFTSGVSIYNGILQVNSLAGLGTGTVTLGLTGGSGNAELAIAASNATVLTNSVVVAAGNLGSATISEGNSKGRISGTITLNDDLTLKVNGGGASGTNTGAYLSTSGVISGTGNLNLAVNGGLASTNNTNSPMLDSLNVTGAVTTSGGITNSGIGTGRALISSNINNASSLAQNSATSTLVLSGANIYSGATSVNAGVLSIANITALSANSTVTVASGGSLQFSHSSSTAFGSGQILNLSGDGALQSGAALVAAGTSNYAGAIVLQDDASILSGSSISTFTLSGGITGSGNTLMVRGQGSTTISGAIATGSGGLTKVGPGLLTLSGANSFTGTTLLGGGTILLNNAGALGSSGNISFDGGVLRHSSSNEADYGSRIANSSGPVSIDSNSRNITYSNINGSNAGGLLKEGAGRLTLSGTNSYGGLTVVANGVLAVDGVAALPGQVFIGNNGALNSGGAYANVQSWLNSGKINSSSTGVIALTGNSSENIDLSGFGSLGLGATSDSTYSGTLTPAGGSYRLGGGGAILTLSGVNALTGANGLAVSGNVVLSAANDLSGSTQVNSGTLTLGASGAIASSAVTVNTGGTLSLTGSAAATPFTRAASVNLNGGTLLASGNSSVNTVNAISNALTIGGGGNSTLTLTQTNSRNLLVTAGSLERQAGGTALIRGSELGVQDIDLAQAFNVQSSNILLASPNLVGGSGSNTTDRGIVVGAVGDKSATGSGFGATGGLLTHDSTKGLRLLDDAEYKSSITDGQTQLDNVRLSSSSGVASTTVNLDTTINSLSLQTTASAGAGVSVTGTGKLTLNSGTIYSNSVTANVGNTVANAIDFNGREGVILVGGSNNLTLSGALSNTGGNGLTIYAPGRSVTLSGAEANTYTGTTTLNGGTLVLSKTAGNAVAGDLLIRSGSAVSMTASNQVADSSNVSVDGGTFRMLSETVNDLTVANGGTVTTSGASSSSFNTTVNINGNLTLSSGGSLNTTVQGKLNVAGTTTLNGGLLSLSRSQNVSGAYDSIATLGAVNIVNTQSGLYRAIEIDPGQDMGRSGGLLVLNGDVTFTGNSSNSNTVTIEALRGTGRQGQIALTGSTPGNRNFNVGNGAAKVDLTVTAPLVDGSGGASGLIKSGAGTLALQGANTYTGGTVVNAGTLLVDGSITGPVTVNGGTLGGSGSIGGALTIASGGNLSPGNSPGITTAGAGLTFETGSSFNFELVADSTAGRGTSFDGVNVDGGVLTIQSGVTANLVFNALGSSTDFNSAFWNSNQSWLVFDNANAASVSGGIFGSVNYTLDSLGQNFSVTGGAFSFSTVGNDVYLNYTAVPEPSTYALLGIGLGALWVLRRRNSKQG